MVLADSIELENFDDFTHLNFALWKLLITTINADFSDYLAGQ